jgi:hypothetical protein
MLQDRLRRAALRLRRWQDRRVAARVLDRSLMARVHQTNRQLLSQVDPWISDEVWLSGVYEYGLPRNIRPLIDLEMGADCTYSDALLSLVPQLRKPLRYMELGVSVGKNFLQVANGLQDASLLGFDIEEINPVLRAHFEVLERREWSTMPSSLKQTPSSLTVMRHHRRSNDVEYLCGDVFDRASWAQLAGRQFNLVFSDAFHSPDALLHECEMWLDHQLLDPDEVIIMWDDLDGDMADAFRESCRRLARRRPGLRHTRFVVPLRGWLGENWTHHQVGFFLSASFAFRGA